MRNKVKWWILIPVMGILGVLFLSEKTGPGEKETAASYVGEIPDFQGYSSNQMISEEDFPNKIAASEDTLTIFVCVTGCVKNPGVYELPEGSRVYEVLDLAGGVTDEAVMDSLNQARVLKDEEIIRVPGPEDSLSISEQTANSAVGKVNINTAGLSELMSLPGIGEQKAQQLIAYRETNGSFTDIKDIMKVSGIGEAIFEKICGRITV